MNKLFFVTCICFQSLLYSSDNQDVSVYNKIRHLYIFARREIQENSYEQHEIDRRQYFSDDTDLDAPITYQEYCNKGPLLCCSAIDQKCCNGKCFIWNCLPVIQILSCCWPGTHEYCCGTCRDDVHTSF